ncbi:tRNA:m(4)X modification enzyme TRM13 homolog isoform X2 [Eutrema salsugineum]|uniref:tRNA:m(4)X modification enzyme TRM13 homolog isoform X2 n=1 Tax=Eutrema salsugineum TaxID=72664 RepID=UPI000CED475C|nr:tRNA:m(4)X modification enzyme TRM13 homolog isoform X2 [Eutrema salsugineum]XP_024009873.1 tRNA:m(4)X modification enzyme TRM13 homolog isoform X2 [Eutrema salsugineum]
MSARSSNRCNFWLPKKKRSCANTRIESSLFCGNHSQRLDGQWIPCPIDPSHSVLQENLEGHVKRCPLLKQTVALSGQQFYHKGINAGNEEEEDKEKMGSSCCPDSVVTSEMKRNLLYSMSVSKFHQLIKKIESVHGGICKDIEDSYLSPEACNIWFTKEIDRKLPFQEKHVLQQGSILGNLEKIGALKRCNKNVECCESNLDNKDENVSAVVEFGAGRGYLTQMLADCYGVKKVYLVERKSYKLKADRSLRQKENLVLERMRIDIEDLNLNAVESLHGVPYVAVGKHLCGPATDLSLRCCFSRQDDESPVLRGLAIATCCHHLCQWKSYINKEYIISLGMSKDEFHTMTWFTSWAVDDDHGSKIPGVDDIDLQASDTKEEEQVKGVEDDSLRSVDEVVKKMKPMERAVLGFKCKQIIDTGRMWWVKKHGLDSKLVKYIPASVSPENTLLIAGKSTPSSA